MGGAGGGIWLTPFALYAKWGSVHTGTTFYRKHWTRMRAIWSGLSKPFLMDGLVSLNQTVENRRAERRKVVKAQRNMSNPSLVRLQLHQKIMFRIWYDVNRNISNFGTLLPQ